MSIPHLTTTQFAEQILFSESLESKLATPESLTDECETIKLANFQTPAYPHRPRGLELGLKGNQKSTTAKVEFPSRSRLSEDRARGLVLHFFANHELLALELMALALLKWPDAPQGFRRGLVGTMREEQSHMRLYLQRMTELNVEFGEARLNSFFWDYLKDLKSPAEFVASMAMTFEQANIDFAYYYETLFRQEGDENSADIMRQVRLDEIGHVKHGVIWFERWREKSETLFKEWQNHLTFPITPARAKGILFDRDGRLQSGLPSDFINELEVHNQSKGRPPRVFWFNPGCEHEIEARLKNWTPPTAMRRLKSDYAPLMGLIANESDVVIVDKPPTVGHLKTLSDCGFKHPEFVSESDLQKLNVRRFWSFEPWGWSPESKAFFDPLRAKLLRQPPPANASADTADQSVFSKSLAARLRGKLNLDQVPTFRCESPEAAQSAIGALAHLSPTGVVVLKSSFSASGRGMLRIREKTMTPKDAAWVRSVISKHGHVLAEPWLEKVIDLSAHVNISTDGVVRFLGLTRFWTDARGQYKGHIIGRLLDDCGAEVLASWHKENGWREQLQNAAIKVGQEISKLGYHGPMGMDAFIYREHDSLKLRPFLEINPRYSMGRLAMALGERITSKHCGLWIHISSRECMQAGYSNFSELTQKLQSAHPPQVNPQGPTRTLKRGVIALNDPSLAQQSLAILAVGRDLNECYDFIRSGGIHDPYLGLQGKTGG